MRLQFEDDSDDFTASQAIPVSENFVDVPTSQGPVKSGKQKVCKDSDDAVPLPNPFPLPKHYPYNVEKALNNQKMTRDVMAKFISVIAGSMLNFKRYPTSQDYNNVAQSIITQFPHLKSPIGAPNVCFSVCLH